MVINMIIMKTKVVGLIYLSSFFMLILLALPYFLIANNVEYYKEVLIYGTDSDIVEAFSNIRKNLGDDVNKLILKLFNENHDIKVYKASINYIKINKIKSAKSLLLKELDRKPVNDDYREDIIVALAEINAKESLNKLIELYNNENISSRIKLDIIDAFGKLGGSNSKVENILINIVEDKKNETDIRAHAVLSLGELKSKSSVGIIRKLLFDRYEKEIIRMYSAFSLEKIEGEAAIGDLSKLINDKNHKVAEYAAKALSDINSPRAGDILMKALRSDYDAVRYYAILGLKKLKYKKAYKILEFKSKYDSNSKVRQLAKSTLEEFGLKSTSETDTKDFKLKDKKEE